MKILNKQNRETSFTSSETHFKANKLYLSNSKLLLGGNCFFCPINSSHL